MAIKICPMCGISFNDNPAPVHPDKAGLKANGQPKSGGNRKTMCGEICADLNKFSRAHERAMERFAARQKARLQGDHTQAELDATVLRYRRAVALASHMNFVPTLLSRKAAAAKRAAASVNGEAA